MKNSYTKLFLLLLLFMIPVLMAKGQDDLLEELQKEEPVGEEEISSTFKGTRLINGHSVETRKKGVLEFIISHRFGDINTGFDDLYGLDESNIRFGLEYGLTDRLYLGLGRSSFEKTFDTFVKYRILQQRKDVMPVSVTSFTSMTIETLELSNESKDFSDKLAFNVQLLIARKISDRISLQIMPTYIHFNTIESTELNNDLFAGGIGGRIKISRRVTFNAEYYYQFDQLLENSFNALAFGVDIETGGHVFQLHITNSRAMIEKGFISETTGDFFEGDIRFGFNISRAFQLGSQK
jgi:hypothetical protein